MSKNYFTDSQIKEIYYSEAGDSIESGAFEFYKGLFNKAVEVAIVEAVADALEEAANIKVNYTKSGRDDALTKLVEDVIQEAVESAISQYKEAIRDLIKRNAKEGE